MKRLLIVAGVSRHLDITLSRMTHRKAFPFLHVELAQRRQKEILY